MPSSDGHFILSIGNDSQFESFCKAAGAEDLLSDEKCSTAVARVSNRAYTTDKCNAVTQRQSTAWWPSALGFRQRQNPGAHYCILTTK